MSLKTLASAKATVERRRFTRVGLNPAPTVFGSRCVGRESHHGRATMPSALVARSPPFRSDGDRDSVSPGSVNMRPPVASTRAVSAASDGRWSREARRRHPATGLRRIRRRRTLATTSRSRRRLYRGSRGSLPPMPRTDRHRAPAQQRTRRLWPGGCAASPREGAWSAAVAASPFRQPRMRRSSREQVHGALSGSALPWRPRPRSTAAPHPPPPPRLHRYRGPGASSTPWPRRRGPPDARGGASRRAICAAGGSGLTVVTAAAGRRGELVEVFPAPRRLEGPFRGWHCPFDEALGEAPAVGRAASAAQALSTSCGNTGRPHGSARNWARSGRRPATTRGRARRRVRRLWQPLQLGVRPLGALVGRFPDATSFASTARE